MGWADFRDSALQAAGIPTGVDLSAASPSISQPTAQKIGTEAGNGIVNLVTGLFSNDDRANAAGAAGMGSGVGAVSGKKISIGMILVAAVVVFFIVKRRK